MYKAIIGQREYEINLDAAAIQVNGEIVTPDIAMVNDGYFHVLMNGKGYRAEVVRIDRATRQVTVKINGKHYDVAVKNKSDLLLEKMGMQNAASGKINSIKAPMPGLIVDLKVKEGDVVRQNDPLLILEAMKMENIIKAPGDGTVKHIKVSKGNSVEKNQVLIEF